MGVALDVGQQGQAPGLKELKYNAVTGEVTARMSEEYAQSVMEGKQSWDRAKVGMQEELDRITAQEQRARATPPILALIQRLGANLAMQEDQPGFVRALGMTSAQLNPDADALARSKLPLHMQIAQLEQARQRELGDFLETQARMGDRALQREAMLSNKELGEETKRLGQLEAAVRAGTLTAPLARRLLPNNATDEEIKNYLDQSRANHEANRRRAALENAQIQEKTVLARQDQEYRAAQTELAKTRAKVAGVVGEQKALETEAKIRLWAANAGYKEAETALLFDRFALERAKYERGTDKMKLDAAMALAGMPWLGDEQVAEWKQIADNLMRKHAKAPPTRGQQPPGLRPAPVVPPTAGRPAATPPPGRPAVSPTPTSLSGPPKAEPVWVGQEREVNGKRVRKAADGWRMWDGKSWQRVN